MNVLGWRHQQGHVGPCAPGDYDDTLYDVPPEVSVRLRIEEDGRPSVAFASEPPDLPALPEASIGPLTEDEPYAWFRTARHVGYDAAIDVASSPAPARYRCPSRLRGRPSRPRGRWRRELGDRPRR